MPSIPLIRATARATDFCFRHAFPLYVRCYDLYKARTDRTVIELIRRLVRSGDRVADIGANVGFYSGLLARFVGGSGRVYAFEPDALNFEKLTARTRRLPQVTAIRAAVAATSGTRTLYRSPDLNVDHRTYASDELREKVSVDAVALDSFLASSEPLQFIKMDIQGGEYDALCGMHGVVARSPDLKILMEMWPFVHERFGTGTNTLLELLAAWGLEVRRVMPETARLGERLTPAQPLPERSDPNAYFDVLCARPNSLPT